MSPPLSEQLEAAKLEWITGSNKYFLPADVLIKLITRDNVAAELRREFPTLANDDILRYSTTICLSGKRIFALLLCNDLLKSICQFVNEGITDRHLPFQRVLAPEGSTTSLPGTCFSLGIKTHSGCKRASHENCDTDKVSPISALSFWSHRSIVAICREQWSFLAPIFTKKAAGGIPHYVFDKNTILPYIDDHEGMESKSGGYSHVWKVRVHRAHQEIYSSTDPNVKEPLLAVKQPFSRDPRDFKMETDMLGELRVRDHPHLIKLLWTYEFKTQYHLVFPFANSNLRDYWARTGVPNWNQSTYMWFLQQVTGITSGLNTIHNFKAQIPLGDGKPHRELKSRVGDRLAVESKEEAKYGRHGDIKPENILWTREANNAGPEGILWIADMGLGRFHRMDSRSNLDPRTVSGSPTYMPPEIELQTLVSRAYDIWSLGCVILEFITWLLEGSNQILTFANNRGLTGPLGVNDDTFYTIIIHENGLKTAVIRQGVLEWISRLSINVRCSGMIRDLLSLVQNRMLVIDSKARISSHDLDRELKKISGNASRDLHYLLGQIPPHVEPPAKLPLPGSGTLQITPGIQVVDTDKDMVDRVGHQYGEV
ncbi:kinase-like domain-containing protein [Tricladium varicosporioides]|nr:kinase-like domain-containing protein [Hymenoscyphus varicosporioides]